MEVSGTGKSPNTALSFRYNANNEELEELFQTCEDELPTSHGDPPPARSESASPKKSDKTSSILDKYFKSMRTEKSVEKSLEKPEDTKAEPKLEEIKSPGTPKEATSSPMKEYLNRLGKRSTSEGTPEPKEPKEPNETWKIFSDFKIKIAQAVEDMKTRSVEETREKSIPRENSTSDSEESSAIKDDQQSIGDTDNQVSSLNSSIQNLSEMTQPLTAKATERESSLPAYQKNHSDSSNDTHKNLEHSDSLDVTKDVINDTNMMDVESGVEALEDTIDAFGDMSPINTETPNKTPVEPALTRPTPSVSLPTNLGLPPSRNNLHGSEFHKDEKSYFFNFFMYFLTFFLLINYMLFPNSNVWNGFLLGIWFFYFVSNLKEWIMDKYFSDWEPRKVLFQLKNSSAMPMTYTIPSVKEHRPLKKYEGWVNHYRYPDYDPNTYHINKTTTAFVKLEGCNLRISYTRTKIAKRALWDEKIDKVIFYQHRLYNLTGARVILLPKGLVKRRQWSKKYPICIILNEKEKIQVLEKENLPAAEKRLSETLDKKIKEQQHDVETAETNTSPEKKRKFVWRKREKSISHTDGEPGREGLRQRIVRKMHRDKKTDSVSTGTEPDGQSQADKNTQPDDSAVNDNEMEFTKSSISTKDDEDEFDDTELSRIKEFLEEADMETGADGTVEGEWSVHVKQSKDKHSHLYLFARTGRDKHEWFRRLYTAISEASPPSTESSAAEERSTSDAAETKDGIEMAVYKVTDKETVSFAKTKTTESVSEGVSIATGPIPSTNCIHPSPAFDTYEKTFWPYLLKIVQAHETLMKQSVDASVMCQLEPSPPERSRNKKKKKDSQTSGGPCSCRALPADVAWVNTVLARLLFDVMRDPHIVARVRNRIQRKLNTLKLPSFMSPLVIRALSLSGACPAAARVSSSWDERGVWLDLDLRYDGGASIDILTQINLMKLKEKHITLEDQLLNTDEDEMEDDPNIEASIFNDRQLRKRKPAIFDSDVEDSAESSSDDESPHVQPVDSNENVPLLESSSVINSESSSSSKKKFLRMVDKIATNKYFQQVTDYKYIKRAMEGLSNTDIKLQLEVQGLEGRLAINLPPPPHDRVWIGFRTNPQLVLKARPAVGARTLKFAHISNWIEQKLTREFEKVLVLPNMEDISVDIMTPTPVNFE